MNVYIQPGKAAGEAKVPPSKSMAHRLLLSAALSDEDCRVENVAFSEDVLATLDCIQVLGKTVRIEDNCCLLSGPGILQFQKQRRAEEPVVLPVRESGSTLRFLIPIAMTLGKPVRFTGAKRLFQRPLNVYQELAEKENFLFKSGEDSLCVCGRLSPKSYEIAGNISSQFISGLLFALALLPSESRIRILPPLESRPYIDMTIEALRMFGIHCQWLSAYEILIRGGQSFAGNVVTVEGGYSSAAYLELLNVVGGSVSITGLPEASLQGDRIYPNYYEKLRKGYAELDLSDCPDLGPCMFAAAAYLHGGHFTGTERLRLKESDRCLSMREELAKFGIRCESGENCFTVEPGKLHPPEDCLSGHRDHRIVMALSALLTVTGGKINDAESVRKSFPEYFDVLKKLGIRMNEYEETNNTVQTQERMGAHKPV